MGRDLIEPEGVNAESSGDGGDPVPGGDATEGPEKPDPADHILGAPPEPAENTDEVFGSTPPA